MKRNLVTILLALSCGMYANASEPMEEVEPDGAFEAVAARTGVTFVDLYADW